MSRRTTPTANARLRTDSSSGAPTLSVVVPVFNQAASIVQNLRTIRERVAEGLGESFEVIVVSDGSIDATEAELVAERGNGEFRVLHYDRNLGKGYAIKIGALEATGDWVGFIDADLDLDPSDLPMYVRHAQEHDLDFAIGSKRHPDSHVHYPQSRVVASWLFQQLVRALFRLDIRDSQVGLKVFRREVAEQVLPLLLVKRYAFDIELLAVARAFGFDRIEEMPVRLDYRFAGSGVRSRAVLRALIDTAAIFYRLRLMRYYQRRRAIGGAYGWTRPQHYRPLVSVIVPAGTKFRSSEFSEIELLDVPDVSPESLAAVLGDARGEVVAILGPGDRVAANMLAATVPFLARDEIAAVVMPKMAPLSGPRRARAAAAVDESRVGAGLGFFRYTPGNVRFVSDFPATTIVIRRDVLLKMHQPIHVPELAAQVAAGAGRVLYTPESVIVGEPAHLFRPHLSAVFRRGFNRAWAIRQGGGTWRIASCVVPVVMLAAVIVVAILLGGTWEAVPGSIVVVYAFVVLFAGLVAALRHRSVVVGALAAIGIVLTHVFYVAGFARGVFSTTR
jgi:glycosyltransferase involved in cell wall biosynthesis